MFSWMHISDTHNEPRTKNAVDMFNTSQASFIINTGDIVRNVFEDGLSNAYLSDCLCVLGNHDCLLRAGADPNGYDWSKQPTQSQLYSAFFHGYKGRGIEIAENQTWWSKKYDDAKVLLLGLNTQVLGTSYTQHEEWLIDKCEWAVENGYSVILASHYVVPTLPIVKGVWSSFYYTENWIDHFYGRYPFIDRSYAIVKSYFDNGMNVICWMRGHEHADGLFFDGFPVISIGSTISDVYNDVVRTDENMTNANVVNYYVYDEETNFLAVYRLGADNCRDGKRRKMIGFDLNDHKIVNYCGR